MSPFSWSTGGFAALFLGLTAFPIVTLGGALWCRLDAWAGTPKYLSGLFALGLASMLGYATFWVYFIHPPTGRVLSWVLLGTSALVVLAPSERRRLTTWLRDPDVAIPLTLMIGGAFVALTYFLATIPLPLPRSWSWVTHATRRIPIPDNALPLLVAQKLFAGQSLHAGVLAEGSTARPPLQAGVVLMQFPAWQLMAPLSKTATSAAYEALGVLLQSSWLLAAWGLARALGLRRGRATLLVVALLPSPVLLLNTIYVWPKLLAASFSIGAYCLLFVCRYDSKRMTPAEATLAAALASLAMLAHPASVTTLLGLGSLLLLPRWFPGWRSLGPAVIVTGLLIGPWVAYQTWFRPLGFTLTKQFLAGAPPRDERPLSELLRIAYLERPIGEIVRNKLTDGLGILGGSTHGNVGSWEWMRQAQSSGILPALGILNVGWPLAFIDPRRRLTVGLGLLCLAVSVALLFESHTMAHTSFGTVLLLFVGLGASLATAPPALSIPLLSLHAAMSFATFGMMFEATPPQIAPVTMAISMAAYGGLVAWALTRERRASHDRPPGSHDSW